jgi:hypothetical protein
LLRGSGYAPIGAAAGPQDYLGFVKTLAQQPA